ncbi:tRNA lysidine(34) synthetase TilS [Aquisalimonas lutea]|uniref:tRNA lysidine(34) synthetase TilS n=1 Tax=Aquisalimonas lutea TaxID=1327750 RepID=UPI0025B5A42D|nr:tRNA lysidine(34) synthetase TilS [Aquisalimonas lutea]MDN3518398.1 tRNA lysidine(34) synthetase TilS [Aquisalimonas lutea]
MTITDAAIVERVRALGGAAGYVVAYSGGPDSHVLLHALARRREALGAPLRAVHVNHRLHPDAAAWAEHCRVQCRALDVPLHVAQAPEAPPAGAGETWAREVRYGLFADALGDDELLVTAHHRDDQAETVLLRLLRGSGADGLGGIPAVRRLGAGRVGRPLLDCSREALQAYAAEHRLPVLHDPGNDDTRADRNFLRQRVLPVLRERWPAAWKSMAASGALLREEQELVDRYADALLTDAQSPQGALRCAALRPMPPPARRRVLRRWLQRRGLPLPGGARLEAGAHMLLEAGADRAPAMVWPGGRVRRYRDWLYADTGSGGSAAHGDALVWDLTGDVHLGHGWLRVVQDSRGLDPAAVSEGVRVRYRRYGERCRPLGRPRRSLKKLFQEAGVPPWQRDHWPLLCRGDDVVAVPGICVCEGYAAPAGPEALRVLWEPD